MLMNWVVSVMYWLVFHYPQPQCLICMWTCISVKLIFCLLFAGSLNPLCVLQLDDPPQKLSTSVLQNTASPAWDQPFILWVQLQCCQKQSLQTPVYRENKNEFVACELNRLVNTCHRLRDIQPTVLLSPSLTVFLLLVFSLVTVSLSLISELNGQSKELKIQLLDDRKPQESKCIFVLNLCL